MIWRRNPFDTLLKKAAKENKKKILIAWNRGLGDIALGLYAMTERIRKFIPTAEITFITRPGLCEGFQLLENVSCIAAPHWKRGQPIDLDLEITGRFDLVIENPNPTQWLRWQLGKLTPKMRWKPEWENLWSHFGLSDEGSYIAVHVQTETIYPYEKNWKVSYWTELFKRLQIERAGRIILFGLQPTVSFNVEGLIDLRGKTSLFEMLSIIKNRCNTLIAPDSGVLTLAYYLDAHFPLKVISLWADPAQGILKQAVVSPNKELTHIHLIGKKKQIDAIGVDEVMQAVSTPHSYAYF